MEKILMMAVAAAAILATAAEMPRPEYPRPQFERAAWVNLNGDAWTYELDLSQSGLHKGRALWTSKGFAKKIVVPFCPESKLSGVGFTDFIPAMWYHRKLAIPAEWKGKRVYLNFGGVDYESEIFIDGVPAGLHWGGSASFTVDLTQYVTPGKTHDLVIRVKDETVHGQPRGKQCDVYKSYGCSYTRTTGIWQTVWLEAVDPAGLKSCRIVPDLDGRAFVFTPAFVSERACKLRIAVKTADGKSAGAVETKAVDGVAVAVPLKVVKTWSPEDPHLYDIVYETVDADGKVTDTVKAYAGLRKVSVKNGCICLNNKPVYLRFVLDQGFYPDGIWTAPSDAALKRDIELSMAAGFNGARLHQKVFEERFHYWADRLGYLTWGEMSSWGSDPTDITAARNFIPEWCEVVRRDLNHPSIIAWTPYNETWNFSDVKQHQRTQNDVYELTKAIDPTRPVNGSSGDLHAKTDLWTIHDYDRAPKLGEIDKPEGEVWAPDWMRNCGGFDKYPYHRYDGQPYLIDEFGGLAWVPPERRAADNTWGYGNAIKTEDEFFSVLKAEVDQILGVKRICGYCYTQLTDVEQEQNGVYYYDRTPKFDVKKFKAIFGRDRPQSPVWDVRHLSETPQTYPVEFPASNWTGDILGVKKIFVEGEPYRGKPTRVFAWVGLPKDASPTNRVPAMVLVHGGGGTAFAYWVKIWNDRGYAAIAMDTCGKYPNGERDGQEHPTHAWSGPSGWQGSVSQVAEPVADQWTYHAVAAVMRCHSYLRSLPEVDPARIGLTGISWGGYLTCIVGSVDPRFRFAAPVYGCGFYDLNPRWCELMGKDAEAFASWLGRWDPKKHLPNNPGVPFHWFNGTVDLWYPLDALKASYETLPASVPLALTLKDAMPHSHPSLQGSSDWGDPRELAALADAYLKDGKPPVRVLKAACEGGVLSGAFDAGSRRVVRAELLYTTSCDALLCERKWRHAPVKALDVAAGTFSVPVPSDAVMAFVNVIDEDGLIVSTRIQEGSRVFDFGPEGTGGYATLTFTDVIAPARVRVSYATHPDGLGAKGDFWHETRAHYMGWDLWLPILPASTDRYDVFELTTNTTWRAPLAQGLVRYVRVAVESGSARVTDCRFANDGTYSTEPVVGSFVCSDKKVDGVWRASVRTCQLAAIPARTKPIAVKGVHTNATLGTTYAYLSDGAKRDRLVWSGDLWFAQRNMYAAFGLDSPFMPGSVRMLAENRTPDGYVQACPFPESHGPLKAGDYGPFASDEFAAWFVPVLRDHVLYSGDLKLAREMMPVVKDLVAYLVRHTGKDGIFEQRLETCKHSCGLAVGGTSLHHRSYMNVLNWKAYADAASLAEWTGEKALAEEWTALADRTAKAVRESFWSAEKGHFVLSREECGFGFEANALALAVKFATREEAKRILPQLKFNWHGKFQFLAARGAFEYGDAEKAMELVAAHNWYKYLDPGWKGTRTVQECANMLTKGWGDEAHPDACLAGLFTNFLLGVEPAEPGYRSFRVRPQPTKSVTSAKGRVPTPHGFIDVEWHLENGRPIVSVRAPEGTRHLDE